MWSAGPVYDCAGERLCVRACDSVRVTVQIQQSMCLSSAINLSHSQSAIFRENYTMNIKVVGTTTEIDKANNNHTIDDKPTPIIFSLLLLLLLLMLLALRSRLAQALRTSPIRDNRTE